MPVKNQKKKILYFIKLLIAAAAIIYLVYFLKPEEITDVLINADRDVLFAVVVLGIINVTIQFLKWKLICNENLNEFNDVKIIKSLFSGFSAGFITPMRVGEYFGRYAAISNQSLLHTAYAVIVDKLTLLFIEIALGGLLALIFIYHFLNLGFGLFIACCFIYIIGVMLFILLFSEAIIKQEKINKILSGHNKLNDIYNKYLAVKITKSKLKYQLILLSVFQFICFITQYALLICSFSGRNEFMTYIFAAGFLFFVKNFVSFLTPGELGTREGLSVFTMSLISVNGSAAFNAALSLFIINILFPSVIGLFFMVSKDDN